MQFWRRLLLTGIVCVVVMVAVLPVLAQGGTLDDVLDEELGGSLWRSWCHEQARVTAIDQEAEVGCMLYRCWCRTQ